MGFCKDCFRCVCCKNLVEHTEQYLCLRFDKEVPPEETHSDCFQDETNIVYICKEGSDEEFL